MALTNAEKYLIRAAIGVAHDGASESLKAALEKLNEQILDDSYPESIFGAENIDLCEKRCDAVFPGAYTEAWAALRRELIAAPQIPSTPATPEPQPSPSSYPTPPVSSSGDFAEAVLRVLRAKGIFVAQNKLGIGMVPESDDASGLQIGGDAAACILGVSNTRGTDGQNPGEVHKNTFVVADNDGGMRWRQYLQWVSSGKKRNTLNRRASILALDSRGDLCKSTEEIGASSDGGQSWYLRTQGTVVEFCTYQVGAFIRILKSVSQYGATDEAQL